MLLYRVLQSGSWTFNDVALILRKQRLSELPAQKLENCFDKAIRGSSNESHEGLKEVLILLIEAGIDRYSFPPFEDLFEDLESCDAIYVPCHQCWLDNMAHFVKHALPHRDIWVEALTTCGYDADQVLLDSPWSKRFPNENDHEFQVSNDSSFTSSDELENFVPGELSSLETQSKLSEVSYDLENDYTPASVNNSMFEQQDWSMLEGDAAVWRT